MPPLFEFKCGECEKTEDRITNMVSKTVVCGCGGLMWKQFSIPNIHLDGTNPDFPGAYSKWGRDREKQAERHRKKSYYEP